MISLIGKTLDIKFFLSQKHRFDSYTEPFNFFFCIISGFGNLSYDYISVLHYFGLRKFVLRLYISFALFQASEICPMIMYQFCIISGFSIISNFENLPYDHISHNMSNACTFTKKIVKELKKLYL